MSAADTPGQGPHARRTGQKASSSGRDRRNQAGRQRHRGRRDAGPARSGGSQGRERKYSAAAPSARRRRADPARLVAYKVLRAVSADDAYGNLVLPREIRSARLGRQDAAFATELTYGTLRARGAYDLILTRCVDRDLDKLDPEVLDALRLGTHQLLGMRVSSHAAVDETVALVRDTIGAGPSGLVNAVLRKVSQQDWDQWVQQLLVEGKDDEPTRLGIRYHHPAWIVRALGQSLRWHSAGDAQREALGSIEDLLAADNAAPEVHLAQLPLTPSRDHAELAAAVEAGAAPSELLPEAASFRGGDISRLPGVSEGTLRVQDIGSQWIARALAAVPLPTASAADAQADLSASTAPSPRTTSSRWLDLCAGPGGKAALLAALASSQGAHLVANEPLQHRAELVTRALSPVESAAWTVTAQDGRTMSPEEHGTFERILVDAPCTGLGALRRRPEARWRRTPADLAELTVLQQELLDAAVGLLEPGGLLAYVTCSPHLAETVVQVEDLMTRHPELTVLDAPQAMRGVATAEGAALIPGTPHAERAAGAEAEGSVAGAQSSATGSASLPPDRVVQLWPHIHGTDAMFLALLQKQ
ncbi:MAG TPA: rRNA small subunit methyltransferase B [Candidatus Nesterenkonia stercoripullorum]|uniref:rRNA small subunit methyltransferase B n=1 Tax=Candidatus Nesterenkonia stercoripullorum TaxID=2838701 RepID=A0A9D2A8R8_9MICC|nr:rRNA small subunit methyltransferase B [Candidatus Nesterenkonia stercoripullorum]